ncbi:MAG: phage virion morphogenesis protein [Deltaproteobacteria bacterium]|nr:phage virion morphogenesis protein [Deltaproteobacteria bacterium]
MSGTAIQVEVAGIERLQAKLRRMAGTDMHGLLDALGGMVAAQTQQRIAKDKTSPDGKPWAPWSERYRHSRHVGHSLLMGEIHLLQSIQHLVSGHQVQIGSNLVYAAIHQFGGAAVGKPGLPARPYLGLSDKDLADIEQIVDNWAEKMLRA